MKQNIQLYIRNADRKEPGTEDSGFQIQVKRYELNRTVKYIFGQRQKLFSPYLETITKLLTKQKFSPPITLKEYKGDRHNRLALRRVPYGKY